jgi:FkbM family methyltransferase
MQISSLVRKTLAWARHTWIRHTWIRHSLLLSDAKEVFQIVYGRGPTQSELDYLTGLSTIRNRGGPAALFRAIVNGYDHQWLNTPFTVRLSREDVEYISAWGVEIAIDNTDISVGLPLQWGSYEPHLIRFYSHRLKPGMTFADIGANIGVYSMLGARLVGHSGHVLCYEPNSENCRLIMLSARRNNFQNLSIYPIALGDRVGHVLFSTCVGSNGSLIPDTQESLTSASCVVVPMFRLDDVLRTRVDCIKMDVEGAEGLVVKGANHVIETYRPMITSEFSMEMLPRISGITGIDYLRYFRDKGYKVFLIDRHSQDLVPITDISTFVRDYGEPTRIEDLAFLPE